MIRRVRSGVVWIGLLSGLVAPLAACSHSVYPYGERVEANYSGRTLTVRLDPSVRVPRVMAALDEVLRDRGYSVASTTATEEAGEMIARGPRVITYPRVVINARQTSTACVVSMRNEPFGDKDQVEQMMRALLVKLGI
ncbi:MAG: hypothetical protein WCK33_10880 [Phycisphaerae bacterium]